MLDDKKLSELAAKSPGKLTSLKASGAEVVVRVPSRLEFRKWKADCQDDRKRLDAAELLLLPCVVYPDVAELEQLFEDKPGLVDTFSLQLLELAGFSQAVEKKAL